MTLVLKIEIYGFSWFFLVLHPLPTPPVFSFPEVFAALVLMVVREDADAPSRLSREGADAGLRAGSGALPETLKKIRLLETASGA